MKEETKKSKKKVLLTYLILAACLLVIAAITVTVIFTVNRKPDLTIDNDNQVETPDDSSDNNDQDNSDNDNDKEEETPTTGDTGYKLPVDSAVVSTRYEFAHNITVGQFRVHQGIDFEGEVGDKVYAVLNGTVTAVVTSSIIGENYVTISHEDGITSTYKYIDAKEGLKVGDTVNRGEIIGTIAEAGGYELKQGTHLHFEMSVNGRTADPEIYLELVEK